VAGVGDIDEAGVGKESEQRLGGLAIQEALRFESQAGPSSAKRRIAASM
jgi:hypothetical protein